MDANGLFDVAEQQLFTTQAELVTAAHDSAIGLRRAILIGY